MVSLRSFIRSSVTSVRQSLSTYLTHADFWAKRVQALGAGLRVKSLGANDLTEALTKGTRTVQLKEKAEIVGAKLRDEDGVANAIRWIYSMLPRAAVERGGIAPGVKEMQQKRQESLKANADATDWLPAQSDSGTSTPPSSALSTISKSPIASIGKLVKTVSPTHKPSFY